ncbi:glycoside hydrolase domain-containing protein [Pseudomonas sp.]|uniref:glycoside hydrolase domain-containing protein n=1 Tax=Pseudomonas sp. TaxID=306 RepID=UPI003F39D74D
MLIIDTPYNTTAKLRGLAKENVQTIIRYYNFSNSRTFPEKCLTLIEAQSICAQGMNIVVVFQQRQDNADDFSEIKGYEAGRRAYRYAHNDIGQPDGSGIYFSVDFDASTTEITSSIIPYFQGVQRAFEEISGGQPAYRVGVYGSGSTASALTKNNLCSLVWLAMSSGFRGTKDAIKNGAYHIEQKAPSAKLCGLDLDYNLINPQHSDFGAFVLPVETSSVPPSLSAATHEVISRTTLRLRGGPGTEYSVLSSLKPGQLVVARPVNTEWSSIDLQRDGLIDGFVSSAFLKELN